VLDLPENDMGMELASLPDNQPTPTNSFLIIVVLCLFIFGGMAFAKFMEKRKQSGLKPNGKA
jgi:hypothetical protein